MQMRYIFKIEFYSVVKRSTEIMKFEEKWIELENIIHNEVTQTQKNKHHMFYLICGS